MARLTTAKRNKLAERMDDEGRPSSNSLRHMGGMSTTRFRVGDKVRIKPGEEHNSMTRGKTGTIQEISTPALGIKFEGMPIHKWYADEEVEPA